MVKKKTTSKEDLAINLNGLKLANPVMVASGTFGYGKDYQDLVPLKKLGAIVTKTITLKPKVGNPLPRIAETYQGMLNAIGLENVGADEFIKKQLPYLKKIGVVTIVSIAADTPSEFAQLAKRLTVQEGISAIELNISCPNLGKSGLIAQDAIATQRVVTAVRKVLELPLIVKLSPNVTDISEIAHVAEESGADILALVNTYFGLRVDVITKKARLGNVSGGLSGPAIKPQALWAVQKVYQRVKIPIIGMGGIMSAEDAVEFIICGAKAVAVGTANFINPCAAIEIIAGIKKYLEKNKLADINSLIGSLRR